MPKSAPAGYVTPSKLPNASKGKPPLSSEEIGALRGNFLELLLQSVVKAVAGLFVSGEDAFTQLQTWATNLLHSVDTAGTNIGSIIDSVSNALGVSGSGLSIADLEDALTNLASLPGQVQAIQSTLQMWQILGSTVGATVGDLVDTIASALGLTGVGHLVSDLVAPLGTLVSNVASALDQLASLISGVSGSVIGDVSSAINSATTDVQDVIDGVYQAIHGGTSTGNAPSTVKTSLTAIPGANLVGSVASSLISGVLDIATIPDLAASKITSGVFATSLIPDITTAMSSALSTVVSQIAALISGVSGSVIGDVSTAINDASAAASGAATDISTLITNAGESAIGAVGTAISSTASDITSLISGVTGASVIGDVSSAINTAGSDASTAATDIGNAVTGLFNNLTGQSASSATQTQANAATASQASTTAANSAAIQSLQATSAGTSNSGLSAVVNMGGRSGLPSSFTQVVNQGAGSITVSGDVAELSPTGTAASTVLAVYGTATQTDYQTVSGVFPSSPGDAGFTGSGYPGVACLVGRCNAAGDTFVLATIQPGEVALEAWVSGSKTTLVTKSSSFVANAVYELVCGVTGSSYTYELLVNGAPIVSYVDSAHVSQVGASYRLSGFGFSASYYVGYFAPSGSLSQWAVSDNAPVAVVGSGFRAYNSSTSAVSVSAGSQLPSGFFDTVEYNTPDLSWDGQTLTISNPGWYMVSLGFAIPSRAATNVGAILYQNGAYSRLGTQVDGQYSHSVAAAFVVYCAAGDTLQGGAHTNTSSAVDGEATGAQTYFEVALLNRSLN